MDLPPIESHSKIKIKFQKIILHQFSNRSDPNLWNMENIRVWHRWKLYYIQIQSVRMTSIFIITMEALLLLMLWRVYSVNGSQRFVRFYFYFPFAFIDSFCCAVLHLSSNNIVAIFLYGMCSIFILTSLFHPVLRRQCSMHFSGKFNLLLLLVGSGKCLQIELNFWTK